MDFQSLVKIMDGDIDLYSQLLKLESEKTTALLESDIEKLGNFINEEQVITKKIANSEVRRQEFLKSAGLPGRTLSEVIAVADKTYAEKLNGQFVKLSSIVNNLKEVNDYNIRIVKSRISFIDDLTDKLSTSSGRSVERNLTYGADAKVSKAAPPGYTTLRKKF